ncbi:MAG: hypothetical protein FWH41_09405, partial [Treponema sp.]|nr:hypothetical protein [Treponema sp.]
ESNPTERYAETIVNTSTSADTRNFTFVIDLSNSNIYSSGDWYKFVIGIDEGGGQVSKLHITAAAGQQISDNGAAARNFSNGSTSNTLQSVDGFRIVSEWGQVHLRR